MGTVQRCLSAAMRVWSFSDCVFVTLNGSHDDDDDDNDDVDMQISDDVTRT